LARVDGAGQPFFLDCRALRSGIIGPDGRLNRARLADLAFRNGRLQELNGSCIRP